MKTVSRAYDNLIIRLAIIAGLMLAVVFVGIITDVSIRSIGYNALQWYSAVAEYCLLFSTMLGAPWLVRLKSHVVVESLTMAVPATMRRIIAKAVYLLCIVLSFLFVYYGYTEMAGAFASGDLDLRFIDMPKWILYLPFPVGFALLAVAFLTANVIGAMVFMGGIDAMPQIVVNAVESVTIFALIPAPLFIIMGELFFHTGLAVRVFDTLDLCFGRLPGRLSYITAAGGTIFTTLSGSTMVPEMTSRGYKKHMSIGPILGTGGLAMIIPPSALAVLLASLAEMDIGKLLIAGVLPGLVLAILYSILINAQVKIDPDAAPAYSVEGHSFG